MPEAVQSGNSVGGAVRFHSVLQLATGVRMAVAPDVFRKNLVRQLVAVTKDAVPKPASGLPTLVSTAGMADTVAAAPATTFASGGLSTESIPTQSPGDPKNIAIGSEAEKAELAPEVAGQVGVKLQMTDLIVARLSETAIASPPLAVSRPAESHKLQRLGSSEAAERGTSEDGAVMVTTKDIEPSTQPAPAPVAAMTDMVGNAGPAVDASMEIGQIEHPANSPATAKSQGQIANRSWKSFPLTTRVETLAKIPDKPMDGGFSGVRVGATSNDAPMHATTDALEQRVVERGGAGGVVVPGEGLPTHRNTPSINATTVMAAGRATCDLSGALPTQSAVDDPFTLAASRQVLEVGVQSGTHGWLRVRAEVGAMGSVATSLVTSSAGAAEGLHRELPAITAFLSTQQVGISSLVVTRAEGASAYFGPETGHGEGARQGQQQRGDGTPRELHPSKVETSRAWSHGSDINSGSSRFGGSSLFSTAGTGGWLSVRV
jgi:hypothetical protein